MSCGRGQAVVPIQASLNAVRQDYVCDDSHEKRPAGGQQDCPAAAILRAGRLHAGPASLMSWFTLHQVEQFSDPALSVAC
jgi:hypothetical protein